MHYLNVGMKQQGEDFSTTHTEEVGVPEGHGAIISIRFNETPYSTAAGFLMPGTSEGDDLHGYFLEPKGPSTTLWNQNQRIPAGVYNMREHSGEKYQQVPLLWNASVPTGRYVLYHPGNWFTSTVACNIPGDTYEAYAQAYKYKENPKTGKNELIPALDDQGKQIWDQQVSNSADKLDKIKDKIKPLGYANVKAHILDALPTPDCTTTSSTRDPNQPLGPVCLPVTSGSSESFFYNLPFN